MNNLRKYGQPSFNIAVLHGGPGAPGEMAPVAKELSKSFGVLEPLQTKSSLQGQVKELITLLKKHGDLPITLVGWSWGAWLGFIFAAQYPKLVKKLILISSGPFEEKYAKRIMPTRLSRLNKKEKDEVSSLMEVLNSSLTKKKSASLARFGKIISKADSYDSIPAKTRIKCQEDIYRKVWKQASELRRSGQLLKLGKKIKCPTVAIHGDFDSHPAEGVKTPLFSVLKNFRFILIKKCGHHPWLEREARDEFYRILSREILKC